MKVEICGAKTRNGTPCKRAPMPNGRCSNHGGKSLAGLASPRLSDGRYSRFLPTRLMARYEEAQADTTLLELRAEVSLVDARLVDVLTRVDTGESGHLWQELATWNAALDKARRSQDTAAVAAALTGMQDTIRKGHADWSAWQDVRSLIDQRRRLVESERKRLVETQQTLTVEKAMLLVGAVAGIIKAHVHDRTILAAISADLDSLLRQETPG